MVFYVIAVAPDIEPELAAWVVATSPGFVAADMPYGEMVAAAGFRHVEEVDVTAAYRETAMRWLHEAEALSPELCRALGEEVFAEKQGNRENSLQAIERGGLVRLRFTARA